jgi:hypothetical protein
MVIVPHILVEVSGLSSVELEFVLAIFLQGQPEALKRISTEVVQVNMEMVEKLLEFLIRDIVEGKIEQSSSVLKIDIFPVFLVLPAGVDRSVSEHEISVKFVVFFTAVYRESQ